MKTPKEEDIITNADESKRLPDENPEPLKGAQKEEVDIERPEEGGNTPPKKEQESRKSNENPGAPGT
ncbi:MAG: hypothetical protein LPK07_14400 [Hymenobacteraceae bacterium]|nr:hypothetical protein [Hymenobacteraceae bacterium]